MKPMDKETMKAQYLQFKESVKSILLSTITPDGKPFASYAPFVEKDGKFYVYLSRMAEHYRNLEVTPVVDVMLLEDESKSTNLFIRQRARFACKAINIGNEGHDDIFEQFGKSFGVQMMNMLRGFDFSLFEINPQEGRYVVGFGQAFDINLTGEKFIHIDGAGHEQK